MVLARLAGALEYIEPYFEKAKNSNSNVCNWHKLTERDPGQPQGRVLFVGTSDDGLSGVNVLNGNGSYVGVTPEAPVVPKK